MAIKRTKIKEILPDIDDEQMKNLLTLIHGEVDAVRDENDDLKKQLKEAEDNVKTANTAKEKAEKDLSDFKEAQAANDTKAAKQKAYTKILEEAGIGEKHRSLILRAADLSSIVLDKDGKIKDADKLSESVKAEYADFIVQRSTAPQSVATPPAGTSSFKSKAEIMQIKNTAERQKAIAENPQLFGQ